MSATKTITFVTGANTGIGLAVATSLARDHGHHVIIGSRNLGAGENAAAALVDQGYSASCVQLDLSSDESITAAVGQVEREFGGVLDVLVNNAGILLDGKEESKGLTTRELFDRTFTTNVVGAAVLTEACLPLLWKSPSPRLVFVSSRMGSLILSTDKSTPYYSTDYKSYDASKAALNMLALNYARILDGTGAMVNVACPGLVKSKLTGFLPCGLSTEEGAEHIVKLATQADGGPTAQFSDRSGLIPW